MSSFRLRPGLAVAVACGFLAVAGATAWAARRVHRAPMPLAAGPALWTVVLGMAARRPDARPWKRRRRRRGARRMLADARFPSLFDHTPVQILEEDLTAVDAACARLRAEGVTNLVAHLIAHPDLAREIRGLVRLCDANRPAIAAAGFTGKAEMIAQFPRLAAAPYPEVFDNQLVALWTQRLVEEEEFRYLDAQGRERACLMLQRISERGGRPDPSRVVLVLLDLTTARRTVEAQMENQEVLRQTLARANILLWWARVHREGEQLRWRINVPSQAYDSPLFQLATARDRGGLWDVEHCLDLPETSRRAETALRDGSPGYQQIFRVRGPDGIHWLSEDVVIHRLGKDEWNLVGVITDITAHHQAEEARRASEAKLHQLLTQADCLLWQASVVRRGEEVEWGVFDVPPSGLLTRLFGAGRPPTAKTMWTRDNTPDWAAMAERSEGAILANAPGYEQEFRVQLSGRTFWLHERVSITPDGTDRWRLSGVIVDVTGQHEAEAARQASEKQLAQILTRADCLLWHANVVRAGDALQWRNFTMPDSVLCERLFGATPPATGTGLWYDTDTSDLPAMTRRSTGAILAGAHGYEQEFSVRRPGRTFWLHEQVSITPVGPGEWNLVGVLMDATARHEAEEARQASEERFRALFEGALEGVYQTTPDGRFLSVNPSMARIFGCASPEEFIAWVGDRASALYVQPGRRQEFFAELGDRDHLIEFESEVRTRDGAIKWIAENTRAVRAPDGRLLHLEGFVTDVTERRRVLAALRASEAQIREILERADCLLWQARVCFDGDELTWPEFEMPASGLYTRLFGAQKVAPGGRLKLWSLLNVPELPEMNQRSRAALRSGAPDYEQDFRVIKPEGTIWLHEHVSITPVGPGEWRLAGVLMDITARREAEEARKASELQLQQILQRADCLMWQGRAVRKGEELSWGHFAVPDSALHQRIFGATQHPTADELWRLVTVPELAEMNARSRAALLAGALGYEHEFRVVTPERTLWLLERTSITRLGPDEWAVVGVVVDVTDRRQAEEARRKAELQLQQILTHASCLLWQARVVENAAGALEWVLFVPPSRLYRELFGSDPAEHSALMWSELNVPQLPDMNARATRAIRGGDPGYEQEFRAARTDGGWTWLHEQVSITRVAPAEWSLVGVITDITARRDAELALAEEKERLAVTLRAMNEGVVTTDTQGVIQYVNRAAAELMGWNETAVVGRPVNEVCVLRGGRLQEATAVPFAQVTQENGLIELPTRTNLTARDGTLRQVEGCCLPIHAADSTLIGTVLVFRDVTEREHLEQELARAAKLESVGILAGGIAHDFNNILTVIMGNLTLAMLDAGELAKVQYYVRESERAALRARDLTQQLLTFAKGGDPIRSAVRLPEIIREVAEFALHGSRVRCEFDFPADLWPADADKGQLGQVVQNLVINSMQAMPEGGVIRISARNVSPTGASQAPFAPGDYVHIAVADTGTGIRAEHLEKIFDPYFTTKQQGSGLGLATVYSIVKKHHGDIEVESELGRGTTFHIWLPASRAVQLDLPAGPPEAGTPLKGRVLLMDDEQTIRDTAGFLLRRLGFEVEVAVDGAETVDKYQAARGAGQPYDLVVMDLTVPGGMGGQEAVARLRQIDPEVKAIVSSGYSSDPVLANYRQYGFRGVVAKPYQLEDLMRVLRDVMAPRPGPG